jgi:hypothetical protein
MNESIQWKDAETEEVLDIKFALVDGYGFGDRFLEGAMFKVTAKLDGDEIKYTCEATDGTREYLEGKRADVSGWEKDATEYVNQMPDSLSHPTLPGDVYAEAM